MDKRWILGGLLLAGGYGAVRLLTQRPKITKASRVLLIGDSLAQGLSPHIKNLLTAEKIPYVGKGVPGAKLPEWSAGKHLPWLKKTLTTYKPSIVLISLGTNDAYSNISEQEAAAQTIQLQNLIKQSGADTIWVGAPKLPNRSLAGAPIRRQVLESIKEHAKNYYDSSTLNIPISADGLHPSVKGFAGWSAMLLNWLF